MFRRIAPWGAMLLFLALFALQAGLSSREKSAAFDEAYHLAVGYAYLETGDFRLSRSHGHPPLLNVLSAIPLLGQENVPLPLEHPAWAAADYFRFTDAFIWSAGRDLHQWVTLGRLPIILLGTLLVAALFIWARGMIGTRGAWLVLLLAAFDPNLLTHSRLVTTDLGLTCFVVLTLWRLWAWLERPGPVNLILVGVLAGLTMTTKFTGLLIGPIILGVVLLYPGPWRRRLPALIGLGLVAYVAIWAVYRFDVGLIPGSNLPFPVLAPEFPRAVWDKFVLIETEPVPAYLLGQTSSRGFWYYFPVALAVKTPLPLLLLAAAGTLVALKGRPGWRRTAVLWLPASLYMALAMTGRITIGYRHILPVVPFLIMLAGYSGEWFDRERRMPRVTVARIALPALLLWQLVTVARLFPHQEAYFNELAGGPERGGEVLADSNIDWGQDLPALKRLMAERQIDEVYLAYFGTAPPEAYGLTYRPLPGFLRFLGGPEIQAYNPYAPEPGWYAISVTNLRLGLLYDNQDIYAYFRDQVPVARAGYSIYLYEVAYPDAQPVRRTTVVGQTVADLPPDALSLQSNERLIIKWVASPATTITSPGEGVSFPTSFVPLTADFAGAFSLLGYDMPARVVAGETLALTLYWQVGTADVPTPAPALTRPLAAFVHLSGDDPAHIVAQYDGWETALTGLETGDIITQQVVIPVSAETPPGRYFIRLGLYSPQSGQRLPATISGETAPFVTLSPIRLIGPAD